MNCAFFQISLLGKYQRAKYLKKYRHFAENSALEEIVNSIKPSIQCNNFTGFFFFVLGMFILFGMMFAKATLKRMKTTFFWLELNYLVTIGLVYLTLYLAALQCKFILASIHF